MPELTIAERLARLEAGLREREARLTELEKAHEGGDHGEIPDLGEGLPEGSR
jgi:hypothetical protein